MFGTDFFLTEREQPEKNTYLNFKNEAKKRTLSNFNNVNAWDQVAGNNVVEFFEKRFLDPFQ